jgi:hypothetical protein
VFVVRVGYWNERADVAEIGGDLIVERLDAVGVDLRKILALSDVIIKIVQFEAILLLVAGVMKANKLPVLLANRSCGYGSGPQSVVGKERVD